MRTLLLASLVPLLLVSWAPTAHAETAVPCDSGDWCHDDDDEGCATVPATPAGGVAVLLLTVVVTRRRRDD